MTNEPLPPGSTIGILGGGQLGRMLAMAAAKLGFRTCILSPEADSPAFAVSSRHIQAGYDDAAALQELAAQADIVTFEFENVAAGALAVLEGATRVAPPRVALETTQDRIAEKAFLDRLGIPVAPYRAVQRFADLPEAVAALSGSERQPLFLKLARQGYDGKGQRMIHGADDLAGAQDWLADRSAVLERAVPFAMELSVIAVRDRGGATVFYDIPRNKHADGVLRESIVPAPISPEIAREAERYARGIADALGYVGVIAVEMFLTGAQDGRLLLVNEIAPRVHNSGHWTTEACAVGQFENHIRAVAGWPLGATARHSDAQMVNLLGDEADEALDLLRADPGRSLHLYGKRQASPGRKMGHYVKLGPYSDLRSFKA